MAVEMLEGEGERHTQQAAVADPDIAQYPRVAGSNPARPTNDEPPIKGAEYREGVLQPGCIVCGQTIAERAAKSRAKVCSDPCRAAYRKWRKMAPVDRAAAPALCCQVCRGPIPHRPNVAWQETCGQVCRNAMRRYRFQVLQNQKCPHCYHPSTPAEWEEFRAWRASQGPVQAFYREHIGRGNFARQREKILRDALGDAISALLVQRDEFLAACARRKMESLTDAEVIALGEQDGVKLAAMDGLLANLRAAVEQSQAAVFSSTTIEKLKKKRKARAE